MQLFLATGSTGYSTMKFQSHINKDAFASLNEDMKRNGNNLGKGTTVVCWTVADKTWAESYLPFAEIIMSRDLPQMLRDSEEEHYETEEYARLTSLINEIQ